MSYLFCHLHVPYEPLIFDSYEMHGLLVELIKDPSSKERISGNWLRPELASEGFGL